jgi:hypothetical protein
MHHLHAYIPNICTIIEAQFIYNMSLKDIHTPAMFVMARTFTLHLSFASMRLYLKKSNRPYKPLVLWTVQLIDQLSILLTHPLCHTKNSFLITNDRLSEVTMDKFIEAFETTASVLYASSSVAQARSCPVRSSKLTRPKPPRQSSIRPPSKLQATTHPVWASSLLTPGANAMGSQVMPPCTPMISLVPSSSTAPT